MIVSKYYKGEENNKIRIRQEVVYAISVHNSLNKGLMCAFFVGVNHRQCLWYSRAIMYLKNQKNVV